jgi:hypothetical protein
MELNEIRTQVNNIDNLGLFTFSLGTLNYWLDWLECFESYGEQVEFTNMDQFLDLVQSMEDSIGDALQDRLENDGVINEL